MVQKYAVIFDTFYTGHDYIRQQKFSCLQGKRYARVNFCALRSNLSLLLLQHVRYLLFEYLRKTNKNTGATQKYSIVNFYVQLYTYNWVV